MHAGMLDIVFSNLVFFFFIFKIVFNLVFIIMVIILDRVKNNRFLNLQPCSAYILKDSFVSEANNINQSVR